MRHSIALASALALTACTGEDTACPAIYEMDGFTLVLEHPGWQKADYSIEVSYRDQRGSSSYRCDVSVPAPAGDAGVDALNVFSCVEQSPSMHRDDDPVAESGKALVLTFEGTPQTAHLVVRDAGVLVLERDIALVYDTHYNHGRHCGAQQSSSVRVELPDAP